jgi:hypothetical protein
MNDIECFRTIKYVLVLLAAMFILPACAPKIDIVDHLDPARPKGYIELFSPDDLRVSIYCLQDGQEEDTPFPLLPAPGGRGVRIAKAPGDYTFIVKHRSFKQKINVRIVENAVVFVTAYRDVVSQRTSVDNRGGQTVNIAYYVDLRVGTHPVPMARDAAALALLMAALSDSEGRTRLHAVEGLDKMEISKNREVLTALNEVAMFDPHVKVRKAVNAVLKRGGGGPKWPEKATVLGGQDAYYRGWAIMKDAAGVSSLEAGKYTLESITSDCTWDTIRPAIAPPQNYDVELASAWKSGLQNREYGLVLGHNKKFYSFGISCSKQANLQSFKNGEVEADLLPWKSATTICQGDGRAANRQRIEVRGENISYYVNDALIGTIKDELGGDDRFFGVKVCGKQKVVFEELSIQGR